MRNPALILSSSLLLSACATVQTPTWTAHDEAQLGLIGTEARNAARSCADNAFIGDCIHARNLIQHDPNGTQNMVAVLDGMIGDLRRPVRDPIWKSLLIGTLNGPRESVRVCDYRGCTTVTGRVSPTGRVSQVRVY